MLSYKNRLVSSIFIPLKPERRGFLISTLFLLLVFTVPQVSVAQFFFGRNKVRYNEFDWQVMQTKHFEIYFYPEMEELAAIGAGYAEEAYDTLQARFDHTINKRIPLIFYSSHFHFQETNVVPNMLPEGVGGFFEYIKGRVVIPSNGSLFNFRHVIYHELVHVFTRSKLGRVLKDGKKGDWVGPPLWFTEGLAEYWSRGWDSRAEMLIRDAIVNNYFFPLQRIYQINGTFLMYKEGQAFFNFFAEKYGENKIIQIFENYWKINKLSKVLEITTGKRFEDIDEEWVYSLKKKYYPILESNDLPGKVTAEITTKGVNSKPAFFKQGGEPHVAFFANRTGYSNVYIKRLTRDAKAKKIIEGGRSSDFESFHLLESKLDATNNGQLTFVSKSNGQDAIYYYDLNKGEMIRSLKFDDLVYLSSPAISPDENKVAFSAIDFSGRRDLYVAGLSDETLVRITNDLYDDLDPAWSPSGESLVFSSDRTDFGMEGAHNLFEIDLNTLAIEQITNGKFKDSSPVWSPDGKFLAFSSDRDGASNLWVIEAGVREVTAPMQLAENDGTPFPASETEAFLSVLAGTDNVAKVVRPPRFKQVTHFVTGAFDPEWTDNDELVFTAFERLGFQLRKLEDVSEIFDSEKLMAQDAVPLKRDFWVNDFQYGKTNSSRINYKKKFSLDIAQSFVVQDPTFGNYGGAQLAMSDILGNHKYYFLIYNDASRRDEFIKNLNVAVTKLDLSRRMNLSYGAYHFAGRYYETPFRYFWERRYGGFFGVSYPISVFKRIETNINVRNSEKEWFGTNQSRKALLVSNFVSFVKDNSLWGRTGPVDGERLIFTLGNTVDVQRSNVNFYTIIADYRRYFRLSQRITFASRTTGSFNVGKETIKFFMGGSWDLRGYDRWSIWGENMFLLSQELRFPLIDQLAVNFPFGGLGFGTIRGAFFLDAGNAWEGQFNRVLGSYGVGARMNLIGFLVLRLDYGKKFHADFDGSVLKPDGLHLDSGTFTQFFFGFDF